MRKMEGEREVDNEGESGGEENGEIAGGREVEREGENEVRMVHIPVVETVREKNNSNINYTIQN